MCLRIGRRRFLSFKPCFPMDSSVTNHSAVLLGLHGNPDSLRADSLTSRESRFIRPSAAQTSVVPSSVGFTGIPIHRQRIPQLQHRVCILLGQAWLPRLTVTGFIEPARSSKYGA